MVVSRDIALKLKEVGYDAPADYIYKPYQQKRAVRKICSTGKVTSFNEESEGNPYYADWCDAPEKGDVFAWFRGKGIIGIPQLSHVFYFVIHNGKKEVHIGESFPTWEQAEDACIEEMIKLIQ